MPSAVTYGSVCSGIESASVAWEPLGMHPAWFAEVEPFPSAVLAHHWPHVANVGDMTRVGAYVAAGMLPAPDVLVGGTPCQAFSVAGKRESLDDERGQLTLEYVRLLDEIDRQRPGRECVAVWENVPGVLSTKDNAFGCFLAALAGESEPLQPAGARWTNAGCVFGPQRAVAWRILDAQFFGVAQRRRRVFVVASARDGFDPAAVLFESEGVRRDSAPRREEGQAVAALTANGVGTCGADDNQAQAGHIVANPLPNGAARALTACATATGRLDPNEQSFVLAFHHNAQACQLPTESRDTSVSDPLTCSQQAAVASASAVRRLTPVECERLQGSPDNHTRIPWRGKPADQCPDGPRYKAIGNSKAVPVVRWIGRRILSELNKCN